MPLEKSRYAFPASSNSSTPCAANESHRRALVRAEYVGRYGSSLTRRRHRPDHRMLGESVRNVPAVGSENASTEAIAHAPVILRSVPQIPPRASRAFRDSPFQQRRARRFARDPALRVPAFTSSSTPATSAIIQSSAPSAAAIAAAASSPFTLMASPVFDVASRATGDTTGRKPPSISVSMILMLGGSGLPALPSFSTSIGSALSRPPSSPEIPTAGIPPALRADTSRLFALPDSTIRTSSRSSTVVTRRPLRNAGSRPS